MERPAEGSFLSFFEVFFSFLTTMVGTSDDMEKKGKLKVFSQVRPRARMMDKGNNNKKVHRKTSSLIVRHQHTINRAVHSFLRFAITHCGRKSGERATPSTIHRPRGTTDGNTSTTHPEATARCVGEEGRGGDGCVTTDAA